MRISFFMIITVLLVFSCKMDSKTPVLKPVDFDKESYAEILKKERESLKAPQTALADKTKADSVMVKKQNLEMTTASDTVHVTFVYGKAKIDTAKLERQRVIFLMNSNTASKILVKLSAQDSLANLRITQIEDSKGNSDGPFGHEVEYQVVEKGLHKVVVSESMMQGDAWGGKFSIEAQLVW